jgi:hypothetical protein
MHSLLDNRIMAPLPARRNPLWEPHARWLHLCITRMVGITLNHIQILDIVLNHIPTLNQHNNHILLVFSAPHQDPPKQSCSKR